MSKFYCLILAFSLLACQQSARKKVLEAPSISVSYTDDLGREVSLSKAPQRIISTAPSLTEMIFAIGGASKIVARSQACDFPLQAEDLPELVTYPEIDPEQLLSFKPDLVLTTNELFSPDMIAHISTFNVPVYTQQYATLEDVYRNIKKLGEILELKQHATSLADSLSALEGRIVARTKEEVKYPTMVMISVDPFIVAGGSGFLHELIIKAGGKNVFADKRQAYYTTSMEEIIQKQPEILILPSKSKEQYPEIVAQFPMIVNIPADRLKQVYQIDPDLVYRPGPRILDGLLGLTNILHSKLTPDTFIEQ